MDDPRPPRRRSGHVPVPDPPSGQWSRHEFGDDATPPPVDVEAASAWQRLRGRVTEIQVMLGGLAPAVDALVRRVDKLEEKDNEMARALISVEKTQAVQTAMLATIERGVADLKSARDGDGARFRHVLQILVAVAAIVVSVIAIVTR